jgi:2-iminobutanoate/2-iminopropanoate deaminase
VEPAVNALTMICSQLAHGLPYAQGVRVDNLVFTHGSTGFDPDTQQLAPGGIGPETAQAIRGLAAILEQAGASLASVVKVTAYLADLSEFAAFDAAYAPFFQQHQPARTVVQVAALHRGARVELDMIARLELATPS